jgi:protein TonB
MSYLIDNAQKLNDIIFANRNRAYGAYAIRSGYGETVLKSLSMMILGVASLVAIAYFMNHKNDETKLMPMAELKDSVYVIPVYLNPEEPKPIEEKTIAEPPAPAVKTDITVLSTNINDSVHEEVTDTTQQLNAVTTATNEVRTDVDGTAKNSPSLAAKNSTAGANKPPGGVKGMLEVDSPPEFEGGLAALNKFIASQLRYPEIASREGQEGKVYIRFVVDETGKVCDLMLMNRAGFGMDEEALRVVSLIPKFKSPAKVQGEAVKAYYQVPIRFHYR